MADDSFVPETTHFGLTRVAQGEPFSKNGWAFSDHDRIKLDQLLYALATHVHDGSPSLGDPSDPATLAANPTGGSLPASTTYYYRVSFVDEAGMESAASDETSVTTPDPMAAPTAPSTTVDTTQGTLTVGVYSYLITFLDSYGGETTPSSLASAQVTGSGTNRVRLDLPDMPTGVVAINVYRARPGQSQFFSLGSSTTSTFYDDGSAIEDQTVVAPSLNTTNATSSITVTIPDGVVPLGCISWRIYRATSSNGYDGTSMVHDVTEGVSDVDNTPVASWTDTGDALQPGFPQNTSSCLPHGSLLTLDEVNGQLPLAATPRGSQSLCAYTPNAATGTIMITDAPAPVQPVRLTGYFATPASAGTLTVQVADSIGTTVSATLTSGNYTETSWPIVGAGHYEAETGTFSDNTVVVDNDDAAPSGAAAALGTAGQWVEVDLGTLEKGVYDTFATFRVTAFGTQTSTNDLQIAVVDGSGTVLAQAALNPTPAAGLNGVPVTNDYLYNEVNGPQNVALNGTQHVYLRVSKMDSSNTNSYDIDSMRFSADVPVLAAGQLTISISNSGSNAGNGNVALWF